MSNKINVISVLTIAGSALCLAGTLMTNMANNKAMKEEIAKQVAEAMKK